MAGALTQMCEIWSSHLGSDTLHQSLVASHSPAVSWPVGRSGLPQASHVFRRNLATNWFVERDSGL